MSRSVTSSVEDHRHLWYLPDGTGLHAPFGRLVVEEGTGRLCCHLCGRWFRSLGSHVRVHGYSGDAYRAAMGLMRSRALVAADLADTIAQRQRRRYEDSAEQREHFAAGQAMARNGDLARAASRVQATTGVRPERAAGRRRDLARGRDTVTRSVVGRDRLHRAMAEAGLAPRPTGVNSSAGKRSRAVTAENVAARRVGTTDLHAWLRQRRARGWTLTRLGDAVGHGSHWVTWRLDAEESIDEGHRADLASGG